MPTAMPIMRATVTVAEAAPKAALPAASTAAVERGVTVKPKPIPKTAADMAKAFVGESGFHIDIHVSPPALTASPTRVRIRREMKPRQEARGKGAQGHGAGQRTEHHSLLLRAAVQDAIDEDRPADDCGGHPVAREERYQGRGAEDPVGEEPRVEEGVERAQAVPDRQQAADRSGPDEAAYGDFGRHARRPGRSLRSASSRPGSRRDRT